MSSKGLRLMLCKSRTKKAKTQKGGKKKKKALPPALKAWQKKVMMYRAKHGVSLKEAMQDLKNGYR
jgi:hypothetical protein